MSNDYSDDYAPTYPVLTSDGAYVHSHMDTIRILFFRDHKVPTHGEKDSVKYTTKREKIQEIRLSRQGAGQICDDLNILLSSKRQKESQFTILPDPHKDHEGEFEQQVKTTWKKLFDCVSPMMDILNRTTEEGQDKIIAILADFIEYKKPQFKEIVDEFRFSMTNRYGEKGRLE